MDKMMPWEGVGKTSIAPYIVFLKGTGWRYTGMRWSHKPRLKKEGSGRTWTTNGFGMLLREWILHSTGSAGTRVSEQRGKIKNYFVCGDVSKCAEKHILVFLSKTIQTPNIFSHRGARERAPGIKNRCLTTGRWWAHNDSQQYPRHSNVQPPQTWSSIKTEMPQRFADKMAIWII